MNINVSFDSKHTLTNRVTKTHSEITTYTALVDTLHSTVEADINISTLLIT